MSFLHGIQVTEVTTTTRSIATIATAVIGLIATAPAADASAFPLDKPVKVTDLDAAIVSAGATGTLAASLKAIAAQVDAPVIVVRVAPGADAAATSVAVIGDDVAGVKTGMQALLAAQAQVGLQPRILGAPGLDTEEVTTALAELAIRLRARVYAAAIGETVAEAIAYRANFEQRELSLIWPSLTSPWGVLDASIPTFAAAHAMGLRAAIDQDQGFHKTLSNVPLAVVDGITKDVSFNIQDADCDANKLNAAQVVTIVRLADGNLRFWGNRTCADPASDFSFESACRTAQVLADSVALGLVWAIDKPLLPSLARDIVEEINEKFRALKRAGQIMGATAEFVAAKNPTEALKQGKLTISYRYTPVPPLEALFLEQEITDEFLADFASLVTANG